MRYKHKDKNILRQENFQSVNLCLTKSNRDLGIPKTLKMRKTKKLNKIKIKS